MTKSEIFFNELNRRIESDDSAYDDEHVSLSRMVPV